MEASDHSQICEHRSCTMVITIFYWLDEKHYRIDLKDVRTELSRAGMNFTGHSQEAGALGVLVARSNDFLKRLTVSLQPFHS